MAKPKPKNDLTFLARARQWAETKGFFGNQAFLRYVMFRYLDAINEISRDFIFKGGNLLWVYINTPRSTVDLDLTTVKLNSHEEVKDLLDRAGSLVHGISYKIKEFNEITANEGHGAAVTIAFKTEQGASNQFEIDIVYRLPTEVEEILSPTENGNRIRAATIENIVADKLQAAHRFEGGNTRMKDFDDLWRLSKKHKRVSRILLKALLNKRELQQHLKKTWINSEMDRSWAAHQKRYPDLPRDLAKVFDDVNDWLKGRKS